jgi:hypothetical protein
MNNSNGSARAIFNAYNYFHVTGAQRTLTASEKAFMNFCMDNHDIICNYENINDDNPVIQEASNLYFDIE